MSDALLTTALLVLARIGGLVVAAPVFGHLLVPHRIRAAFALALTAVHLSRLAEDLVLWCSPGWGA